MKPKQPDPTPIIFPRADPAALATFDPSTKVCTMGCGPHSLDPRSDKERKFLCEDCVPVLPSEVTDKDLIDWIDNNSCSIEPIDDPTPVGDDADMHWEVFEFHMAKPHKRSIGWGKTIRKAIKSAMKKGAE